MTGASRLGSSRLGGAVDRHVKRRLGTAVRATSASLLAGALLAACTSGSSDGPLPTSASGDDIACGMSTADVETATGLEVGRVVGDLSDAVDDDGTRVCEVWPVDQDVVDGAVVLVRTAPTSSPTGAAMQSSLDADGPSDDPPDETFDGIDAAGWLGDAVVEDPEATSDASAPAGPTAALSTTPSVRTASTAGGTVVLVSGSTAIKVTTERTADGRSALDDALALAQQVAGTLQGS